VNRFPALGLSAAVCLTLSACGGDPGDEMAQAACRAYAHAPSDRATADERAKRAGEANESYASLQRDMDDAWARSDAMAAAHNSGQEVSAEDLNAYFAADKQVRADCADAGADLGPLEP
jgi:hypothetical protein